MHTLTCTRCKNGFRRENGLPRGEMLCPLCAYFAAGTRKTAELAVRLGEHFADQRQLDNALAAFTEAIQLSPKDPAPYAGRANVYLARKDYPRAIHQFTEAVRLAPQFADAYANRALCHLAMKNFDAALADLNTASKMAPSAEIVRRIEVVRSAREQSRPVPAESKQPVVPVDTPTPRPNGAKALPGTERKYVYRHRGKLFGPYSSVELKELADRGLLEPNDEVQKQGHSSWKRAAEIEGIFTCPQVSPRSIPEIAIPSMAASMEAADRLWAARFEEGRGDRKYCYRRDGVMYGPYTAEYLRELATSGILRPRDEVSKGDSPWRPASELKGLFAATPPSPGSLPQAESDFPPSPKPAPPPDPNAEEF